jgi:hypothetical protein
VKRKVAHPDRSRISAAFNYALIRIGCGQHDRVHLYATTTASGQPNDLHHAARSVIASL